MNRTLVLAEKPSVGRDIAKVLNCYQNRSGYIEGQKYIVTWALGHLVTLAEPEAYDQKYKSWRLEDLPMIPSSLKLVVIKKTGKQFNIVKSLMNRKDVSDIVIATDSGREGELVGRLIIEKSRVTKPIKRLWISSVTDRAIKEGFNRLKDGKEYENLYASAVARSEADWYVGINATRALTCKFNAQLSCGRVQTPTLAIIAQREEEIKNFKPRKFYGIKAKCNGLDLVWQDNKTKKTRSFNRDTCDSILNQLKNKNAKIVEVNKTSKKTFAPKLYDLTELQRDANKIFDFSAKETLSIMQSLYERHKLLTYPRTDSRYISTDIIDTLQDRIKACGIGPYSKSAMSILRKPIKTNKSFVDNSKVSDHHAIIPTEQWAKLDDLTNRERKIYDLVVKRFFAVLYPPFKYEQITIKSKIGGEDFIAKGKVINSKGWKEVYGDYSHDSELEDDVLDQILPEISMGDVLDVVKIYQTQGETNPPKPFNEATLLSAMENPAKYLSTNDKDIIKTLGETGGLGTVATRADIIEKLFKSFSIEKRGKGIFITSKGRQLLELVPEDLKSPALTGEWEQKLDLISKGHLDKNTFINEMKNYAKEVVKEIKDSDAKFKHDNLTGERCPECNKFMLEVKNKNGKMLVCQDRECGYRKGIARITNSRCPECRKKLELRGEGEGKIFVCSRCGYKEKLSSFNNRKKDKQNKGSKKDVARYKQKQKKADNEPFNPALAEALAKLKLD